MSDHINPDHYKHGGYETIDILRAKMDRMEFDGFLKGNIIKYLLRASHKPGEPTRRDYEKAAWYANMLAGNDPRDLAKSAEKLRPLDVKNPMDGARIDYVDNAGVTLRSTVWRDGRWNEEDSPIRLPH